MEMFLESEKTCGFGKVLYFRKLTYTNGETTGSTEYNPYFTEGINGDISQFPENKTLNRVTKLD